MRFIISIVAALMILGLAAFGVVSAQKMSTGASQATASDSSAASASQSALAAARRHPINPVNQLAQVAQTAAETAIEVKQLAHEDLDRPAIADDVMHDDEQHAFARSDLEHRAP